MININNIYTEGKNIVITKLKDKTGKIGKTISLVQGTQKLKKEANITVYSGVAETCRFNWDEFFQYLKNIPTDECLLLGNFNKGDSCEIVTTANENRAQNKFGRNQANFGWSNNGFQLCYFDFDGFDGKDLSIDDFIDIISEIIPDFRDIKKVINYSSSSNIYKDDKLLSNSTGFHMYFLVKYPEKIADILSGKDSWLMKKLWLNGYGFIKNSNPTDMSTTPVSQSIKTIFDDCVFKPERPVFEAAPTLLDGLIPKDNDPIFIQGTKEFLDLSQLESLSNTENIAFAKKVKEAKEQNEKKPVMLKSKELLTKGIRKKIKNGDYSNVKEYEGLTDEQIIRNEIRRRKQGELLEDFEIQLSTDEIIKVRDILDNKEKFHKQSCCDPHERDYGNKDIGIIYTDKETPVIFSHAHGGKTYKLKFIDDLTEPDDIIYELSDVLDWIKNKDTQDVKDNWLEWIFGQDDISLQEINDAVSKRLGLSKTLIKKIIEKKIYDGKVKQEEKKGKKAIYFDGTNYGVATKELSELFGKGTDVFRYAGSLVSVEHTIPATVKAILDGGKTGEYPIMPIILHHRHATIRSKIENIAFFPSKGKITGCRDSLISSLLAEPNPLEKPLTGIVEHPYVDAYFNVMSKNGYDKKTGLYIVLDPKLENIELNNVTKEMGKNAYKFITEEVFDGFPFESKLDEAGAVAALLTAIQRKMITTDAGCPGFLINANTFSSGKTTLANAISYSVFNRQIGVTTFSDKDTEMAKHLLGIFQEGQGCVNWDNIPEGSVLASNEIAKAMTSPLYSGRLLGKNETITLPTSTLFFFTGVGISVCNDFNTRIIPIELNPKMENPDERTFSRTDIGDWCQKNRYDILNACLTIILCGKDFDSAGLKQTRFPEWNKYVRNPILNVSGVDIAKFFQNNKQDDPKKEGQLNLLKHLHKFINKIGTPVSTKDIIREAQENHLSDLSDAIKDIFNGDIPTTNGFSRWLSGIKKRQIGDYKLVSDRPTSGDYKNITVWSVEKNKAVLSNNNKSGW